MLFGVICASHNLVIKLFVPIWYCNRFAPWYILNFSYQFVSAIKYISLHLLDRGSPY